MVKAILVSSMLWAGFWLIGLLVVAGPWYYIAAHAVGLGLNAYVLRLLFARGKT